MHDTGWIHLLLMEEVSLSVVWMGPLSENQRMVLLVRGYGWAPQEGIGGWKVDRRSGHRGWRGTGSFVWTVVCLSDFIIALDGYQAMTVCKGRWTKWIKLGA